MNLKIDIESCNNCILRNKLSDFEKPIFGVGSSKPKVILVIDNNTSESIFLIDNFKLKYLEKNLKEFNINKCDLYITPLVKCSRKPIKSSLKECVKWIEKEIDYFKPNAIFFITNSEFKLSKSYNNIYYIPTSLHSLSTSSKSNKDYTETLFNNIKRYCD